MAGVLAGVSGFLLAEAALHRRRLRRIPIRIHVNGTRGKSSVTRALAAALRAAGVRTLGKVTGDAPLLILPDGTEEAVRRRGAVRIQEQVWFMRRAAALRAEAIVVECMALEPEFQHVSEARMIEATIGVITNVRPDHFEVMGDTVDEIAWSLARTIPRNGVLVTADRRYADRFAAWARARGSESVCVAPATDTDAPLEPAAEHAALVAAVGVRLRLPAAAVAAGLAAGPRMPVVQRRELGGCLVHFFDAFSANDPVSSELLLAPQIAAGALPSPRVAVINHREDRPRRTASFAAFLSAHGRFDAVAFAGGRTPALSLPAPLANASWRLEADTPENVVAEIGRRLGCREFSVVGLANAKGPGLALAAPFRAVAGGVA